MAFVLCFFFVKIIEAKQREATVLEKAAKRKIHYEANVYIS
jgi:hypothetical protein